MGISARFLRTRAVRAANTGTPQISPSSHNTTAAHLPTDQAHTHTSAMELRSPATASPQKEGSTTETSASTTEEAAAAAKLPEEATKAATTSANADLKKKRRIRGLDGLRAIAVALVLVYHYLPDVCPQGYVGVDAFFVLSGFLITYLLVGEHRRTGRISLKGFWARRARRILPPLLFVVLTCSALATLIGGDALYGLHRQVLTSLTFSYNWGEVIAGSDYFTDALPKLFTNFWSLAVEEQFYLLWPLIVAPMLATAARVRHLRRGILLGAGLSFALALVLLFGAHADPSRIHMGTDTHAYGLLLGAWLGVLAPGMDVSGHITYRKVGSRFFDLRGYLWGLLALTGLAALLVLAFLPASWNIPMPILSGIASIATLGIVASLLPGNVEGGIALACQKLLSVRPLEWLGTRSYALYLWHWPTMVLFFYTVPELDGLAAAVVISTISLILAELSWRFLEGPILSKGFTMWVRHLSRTAAAAIGVFFLTTLGILAYGLLHEPQLTTTEQILQEGAEAETSTDNTQSTAQSSESSGQAATQTPSAEASATATPSEPTSSATPSTPAPSSTPQQSTPSAPLNGTKVTIVGDSVTLAAAPALQQVLPGVAIDAKVSRGAPKGPSVLQAMDAAYGRRPYVVVGLATNGVWNQKWMDALIQAVGPDRKLILVTGYGPARKAWIANNTPILEATAAAHPGQVFVADWAAAIGGRTDLLAGDQIHPGKEGGKVYAETIAQALRNAGL